MQNEKFQLLLEQMVNLNIISKSEHDLLMTKSKEMEWEISIFPDSMILIPVLLRKVSKAAMEDCENGQVPPDYNLIIPSIFKLVESETGQPKVDLEYKKNDGRGNDYYKLILEFGDGKFEKVLKDTGDYFDIDGIQNFVNEILATKNSNFQLIDVDTNDQAFCLSNVDKVALTELYGLYNAAELVDFSGYL